MRILMGLIHLRLWRTILPKTMGGKEKNEKEKVLIEGKEKKKGKKIRTSREGARVTIIFLFNKFLISLYFDFNLERIRCLFGSCCFVNLLQVEGVFTKLENEPKEEHKKRKKKQSSVDEVIDKLIVAYVVKEATNSK